MPGWHHPGMIHRSKNGKCSKSPNGPRVARMTSVIESLSNWPHAQKWFTSFRLSHVTWLDNGDEDNTDLNTTDVYLVMQMQTLWQSRLKQSFIHFPTQLFQCLLSHLSCVFLLQCWMQWSPTFLFCMCLVSVRPVQWRHDPHSRIQHAEGHQRQCDDKGEPVQATLHSRAMMRQQLVCTGNKRLHRWSFLFLLMTQLLIYLFFLL